MLINVLSDVIWTFYQDGRLNATKQTFRQEDILQMVKMTLGNMQRQVYVANKKVAEGAEYYASAPLLSIQRFELGPPDAVSKRRADMSEFDLYRLPQNAHVTNVYPASDSCPGNEQGRSISQVSPGEENFYLFPKFNFFQFFVVKGRNIYAYHLLPCTKYIDVESTFDTSECDVSLDIAYDIAQQVLGTTLRIPGFNSKDHDNPYLTPQMEQLKRNITQPNSTVQ